MTGIRDLPDSYPVRVFMGKEEGWVTEQQAFKEQTREIWDEVGEDFSAVWPQALRWVILFDKFLGTGDEKVSAELRQLEDRIFARVAESDKVGADSSEDDGDGVDEVAEMRARIAAAASVGPA